MKIRRNLVVTPECLYIVLVYTNKVLYSSIVELSSYSLIIIQILFFI